MLTVTLVYEALLLKHLSHKFSDHKKNKNERTAGEMQGTYK